MFAGLTIGGFAAALLKGSAIARIAIIVFGVFELFSFPFGTVLGAYTLWALLRKQQALVSAAPAAGA